MIHCLSCAAETGNGLALCELCRRKVVADLEFLPIYFRNLARWRPGRAGSRPVPGSRVLYDGSVRRSSDRIGVALDSAGNTLVTWAKALVEDRPPLARLLDRLAEAHAADRVDDAQVIAWLCRGFERYLTSISTLDWCGEFVRDLGQHETILRELTEGSVPGWYAGACKREDCRASTYVVPGLTWVRCGGCGTTTYARDHLDVILDEARGWTALPIRLAEALVALLDTEMSIFRLRKRIGKWGERERITPVRRIDADGDEVGPKRYRLGEVLDVLLAEGATRLGEPIHERRGSVMTCDTLSPKGVA